MKNELNIEQLEKRLEQLQPARNDTLAAKILAAAKVNGTSNGSAGTTVFPSMVSDTPLPAQHASCFASTLPLLTGLIGAVVGAAAMFFAVTLFVPPKVEIREIVWVVPAEISATETATATKKIPDAEKNSGCRKKSPVSDEKKPARASQSPNWLLSWLPFSFERPVRNVSTETLPDIDALLAEHEANTKRMLASQAFQRNTVTQTVRYVRDPNEPRLSPKEYRERFESYLQ